MGVTSASSSRVAEADCKDVAIHVAAADTSLRLRRGYVVITAKDGVTGFTEHWWCSTRSGAVCELTGLVGLTVRRQYVELEAAELVSFCDALSGPCAHRKPCPWCRARHQLEAQGVGRVRLRDLSLRLIVDRLWEENSKLRQELLKGATDVSGR